MVVGNGTGLQWITSNKEASSEEKRMRDWLDGVAREKEMQEA